VILAAAAAADHHVAMGTLSYTATVSIDGYAADADGDFNWSAPGDDVFRFHVERMDAVSAEILGRRTYRLMRYWEAEPDPAEEVWGDDEREFARRWCELELVVASSTLGEDELGSRARLVRDLQLDEIRGIADAAPGEVEIFGPTTAAPAIRAGLVRDYRFFVVPMMVGGGLQAIPNDVRQGLQLVEQRVFDNGTVLLHYRPRE